MRVLHVYKNYHPILGGIENHVRCLAEGQAARGCEVSVLAVNSGIQTTDQRQGSLRILKTGRLCTIASTPLSIRFFFELARLEADVTHLHFPYPPGEIGHLVFGRGRRLVVTYHSDIIRQKRLLPLFMWSIRAVLGRADRIISTSPDYARSSPVLSGFSAKCRIIPLGIDIERFQGAPRDGRVRSIRGNDEQPLILFVGRLRYYKGLGFLLQAMKDVHAKLLVIGTGPMERAWVAKARDLGLSERAVFLGDVGDEELPDYYRACDVFVLPASDRSEAFGLVLVEAMASGRPVVSTSLGTGTSYVNVHGETGLVVPPRNPAAMAAAVNLLLEDEALRRGMGEAGRRRAEREFSSRLMIDRTLELYRRLC